MKKLSYLLLLQSCYLTLCVSWLPIIIVICFVALSTHVIVHPLMLHFFLPFHLALELSYVLLWHTHFTRKPDNMHQAHRVNPVNL